MYRWCSYLLWGNCLLSFWAKGKIVFHLPGESTWYRAMPFYAWQVDFPHGFVWHFDLILANLVMFALLQVLLKINFDRTGKAVHVLMTAWLLLLLLSNYLNLSAPVPHGGYLLLQLVFWGYLSLMLFILLFGRELSHKKLLSNDCDIAQ